ncbi:MAG TPA: hypothetical protein VFQ91_05885 [Bryobacteraceae bacterium]|nr:hypothetical protein [Bryobacteraceae bacterium]
MRRLLLLTALACTLFAGTVNRGLITSAEVNMNKQVEALFPGEQFVLLGHAQGVYLDGFGCVFTMRLNLAEGPGPNPFLQQLPASAKAALHKKKLDRLPVLKERMRDMLVSAAVTMDPVPPTEKMVLSVSLLYMPHEDTAGLPSQIVMQAPKKALLGFLSNRAAAEQAVQVREY